MLVTDEHGFFSPIYGDKFLGLRRCPSPAPSVSCLTCGSFFKSFFLGYRIFQRVTRVNPGVFPKIALEMKGIRTYASSSDLATSELPKLFNCK